MQGKTDIAELLGDLNAGVFEQQINTALSDIAANVCTHGKDGELTIKFKLKQIGEGNQVSVTHSIKSVVPKPRGRITEENATDTPLHVERGGKLTLYPNTQTRWKWAQAQPPAARMEYARDGSANTRSNRTTGT